MDPWPATVGACDTHRGPKRYPMGGWEVRQTGRVITCRWETALSASLVVPAPASERVADSHQRHGLVAQTTLIQPHQKICRHHQFGNLAQGAKLDAHGGIGDVVGAGAGAQLQAVVRHGWWI